MSRFQADSKKKAFPWTVIVLAVLRVLHLAKRPAFATLKITISPSKTLVLLACLVLAYMAGLTLCALQVYLPFK